MQYFITEELRQFAAATVDTMETILSLHGAIVDADAARVAGGGCFSGRMDEYLPAGHIYGRAVSSGTAYIVDNPGKSRYCSECFEKDICREKMVIIAPVKWTDTVMGAMSLAAITDAEKDILTKSKYRYMRYLEKMAGLVASRLNSEMERLCHESESDNLRTIMAAWENGVMIISSVGEVIYVNQRAEIILGVKADSLVSRQYTEKISCKLLEQALAAGEAFRSVKSTFSMKGGTKIELVMSLFPSMKDGRPDRIVCFFEKYKPNKPQVKEHVKYSFNNIQGRSPEIKDVIAMIKKFASSNSTVLITGESGTGKELFARAIHYESNRRDQPFIAINCSAIPDTLLESELFGYVRGAFTNANSEGKIGRFELANKGTIFLDEIGDMPLNLQAKLLRVLQDKKIERLGDTKSIYVDIRIIAATNRDLKDLIREKTFREDLYYRINVIPLHLPPLRRRKGDVSILSNHFLEKYNGLLLKNIRGFLPETLKILSGYGWPGNVRELENVIEYAVNMEATEFIMPISLPSDIVDMSGDGYLRYKPEGREDDLQCTIDEVERLRLEELLAKYGDSTEAKKIIANKLNISLSTLYRRLRKFK